MSADAFRQPPLAASIDDKTNVRTQFAALCYRISKDKPQVLLITSRGTKRWILPKGWPMPGLSPSQAAATEAWEEAGVKGRVFDQSVGLYSYKKVGLDTSAVTCAVMVYPVKVKTLQDTYPEMGQRKRRWVSRKKAASLVDEPDLKQILKSFDPRLLRR